MILRKIFLSGFRSFLEGHELSLNPGSYFILGENHDAEEVADSNAAGKTSLVSVIPWALYGKLPTGAEKDNIIHDMADEVRVKVIFDGLTVERWKRRKSAEKLVFRFQGEKVEEDLRITQEKLEKVLGVSARLFFNSIWLDRESRTVQFLFSPPAKRVEILEEILESEAFSRAKKVTSSRTAELSSEIHQIEARLQTLWEQEANQRRRLQEAQASYAEAAASVSKRRTAIAAKGAALREEIRLAEEELSRPLSADQMQILREMAQLKAELEEVRKTKIRWASLASPDVDLLSDKRVCPTCLRKISPDELRSLRREVEEAAQEFKKASSREVELSSQLKALEDSLTACRQDLLKRQALQEKVKNLKAQLQALGQEVTEEDPALVHFRTTIERAQDALRGIQKTIEDQQASLFEVKHQLNLYRFWDKAFSSRGIRSLLLDDVRGILSHFSNLYARKLAGKDVHVEFPKSETTFEVLINHRGVRRDASDLSRGEVWRVNFCILLGIRKALYVLNRTGLDLLVVDDPVGDLDVTGGHTIVDLCRSLEGEIGHVFTTLPREFPGIPEDRVLMVEKRNGISRIVS
jgi:DNA repair exonuclease SbcCD ATPase subunit